MDRNTQRRDFKCLGLLVALRKESVDRNRHAGDCATAQTASLSARRAWIEIMPKPGNVKVVEPSLSARRAWIEIVAFVFGFGAKLVALRKESVDRNHVRNAASARPSSRSPQGERG